MGIYHDVMGRRLLKRSNIKAAEVDVDFFVFSGVEALDDYSEVVDYYCNLIDSKLIGLEPSELEDS